MAREHDFLKTFERAVKTIGRQEDVAIKKRKTVTGKRWLLTAYSPILRFPVYLTLDFSMRERVLHPQKSTFQTAFPVIFTGYIHHLSMEEILAEKIRAIMTRRKGRDLYDLWYLTTRGATINHADVKEKLSYYHVEHTTNTDILSRVASFPKDAFIRDLQPFVPLPERAKLGEFYDYTQTHLKSMFGL